MLLESNSHIFVQQEDDWDIKGRYSQAIQDQTPVVWKISSEGKYTLSLLAVSALLNLN